MILHSVQRLLEFTLEQFRFIFFRFSASSEIFLAPLGLGFQPLVGFVESAGFGGMRWSFLSDNPSELWVNSQ